MTGSLSSSVYSSRKVFGQLLMERRSGDGSAVGFAHRRSSDWQSDRKWVCQTGVGGAGGQKQQNNHPPPPLASVFSEALLKKYLDNGWEGGRTISFVTFREVSMIGRHWEDSITPMLLICITSRSNLLRAPTLVGCSLCLSAAKWHDSHPIRWI